MLSSLDKLQHQFGKRCDDHPNVLDFHVGQVSPPDGPQHQVGER